MLIRSRIVGARSVAGRIAAVSAAVALLASAAGFSAPPAAAGLVSGFSSPERSVLQANSPLDADPQDVGEGCPDRARHAAGGADAADLHQLTVTVTQGTEVENFVECIDPAGDRDLGVNAGGHPQEQNSGTNYLTSMGHLTMHGSLLFTAPFTGTFLCQVRAHADAGSLTALAAPPPGGTWLEVDNFTSDAPLWWQTDTCDTTGRDPHCIFLGLPLGHEKNHPVTTTLFEHDGWIAAPDATMADVVAHMQIDVLPLRHGVLPGARMG